MIESLTFKLFRDFIHFNINNYGIAVKKLTWHVSCFYLVRFWYYTKMYARCVDREQGQYAEGAPKNGVMASDSI
jgi:hypothetical protein